MSVKASPGLSPEKENQNQNPQGFKNLEGLRSGAIFIAHLSGKGFRFKIFVVSSEIKKYSSRSLFFGFVF